MGNGDSHRRGLFLLFLSDQFDASDEDAVRLVGVPLSVELHHELDGVDSTAFLSEISRAPEGAPPLKWNAHRAVRVAEYLLIVCAATADVYGNR